MLLAKGVALQSLWVTDDNCGGERRQLERAREAFSVTSFSSEFIEIFEARWSYLRCLSYHFQALCEDEHDSPTKSERKKRKTCARKERKENVKSLKIRKNGVHGRAASVFSLEFPFFIYKRFKKTMRKIRGVAPLPMSVAFRNAKSELLIYSVLHVVT